MKKSILGIFIVTALILIVLVSGVMLNSAFGFMERLLIKDVGKHVATLAVDEPVLVKSAPSRNADKITFEGRTYKMFCQYSKDYEGYNKYLAAHGCTVTSLTAILRAYVPECAEWTPYETITIAEKETIGTEEFVKNYKRTPDKQKPFSFYGVTQILDKYGVSYVYEPYFSSDEELKTDIIEHLHTGDPVMFVISQHNRETGDITKKWTLSYHTMVMIGVDENNNVLIGNPAGSQRFQMVSLDEMINYMWSCSYEPDSFYWNGKPKCGGYIKIISGTP